MNNTKKLVLAGLFIALSVVGGALIIILSVWQKQRLCSIL